MDKIGRISEELKKLRLYFWAVNLCWVVECVFAEKK